MMSTPKKASTKWSMKKQFITYIMVSTLIIIAFTFGISILSQSITTSRSDYIKTDAEGELTLQPPMKGFFHVPTISASSSGSQVGFELNTEVTAMIDDIEAVVISDYQKVFLFSFIALILTHLIISYFFIQHRFISPLEEASKDVEKLVSGDYGLNHASSSPNEIYQLKHHIFKLSESLNHAENYKRTSEHQRKTLIAGLSHDLKTPLTNIIGYSETLQMNPEMTKENQAYLSIILRNAQTASQLIQKITQANLYDYTDNEKELVQVSLSSIFSACNEGFKKLLTQSQQSVITQFDADRIDTDPELLARIFNNLIQNFIDHSGNGSTLSVLSYFQQDQLVIVFRDNGVGVPQNLVPHLTELMYKVDASRSALGNSGIGLYNVQVMVTALNGVLQIESAPEQGMCITMTFQTTA